MPMTDVYASKMYELAKKHVEEYERKHNANPRLQRASLAKLESEVSSESSKMHRFKTSSKPSVYLPQQTFSEGSQHSERFFAYLERSTTESLTG